MPYIESNGDRDVLDDIVYKYITTLKKKGCLNYFLCRLFMSQGISYEKARNFIGEMECAKIELYRRWVAPYEDQKKEENGDVRGF